MTPVVFINCDRFPFVDWIMTKSKLYETRNRNTLRRFVGERVLIAETRKGHLPLIRCAATIESVTEVFTEDEWIPYIMDSCISNGSMYDWQPDTKKKVLYKLSDVFQVVPFFLTSSARRHGRTWAEFNGIAFFG